MVNNYSDFILDKLIQESILYFSPDLRKKLKKMKLDISQELLNTETQDIKDDITFIDVDKDGYVSYNTMKNAAKFFSEKYPHLVDTIQNQVNVNLADEIFGRDKSGTGAEIGVYTKSRNRIKFGRLINKILPGKFTPGQIEEFSNKWKSILENAGEKIQVVEGDDIAYWYKSENYKEQKGTLGSSCMRGNSEDTFKIYTMNPDLCKMIIITDNDELVARAIVWKVTEKSVGNWEWFMDRQYSISDDYVERLRNYAIEQGWAYKTHNNHHSYSNVSWKESEDTIRSQSGIKMKIQLAPYRKDGYDRYDYRNYPYVDTFRRYDPHTGWLFNDDEQVDGCYLLDDTGGGYSECETGVWSDWHDERIPEDEAVYSDVVDSYLWSDRAVEVSRGSRRYRGWYPEGHDDLTYDEWIDEYINVNDAVYSDAYGHFILSEDSESAIYKLDSDGEPNRDEHYVHSEDSDYIDISDLSDYDWYKKLSEEFRSWENGYTHTKISKDLLTKDFDGDWIPQLISMRAYRVVDNPFNVPFLSKLDAKILDLELNLENPLTMDKYRYNDDVKEIYPELLNKAKEKLEVVKSQENQDSESSNYQNKLVDRIDEIEEKTWLIEDDED
jgi:hypothetical protein